MSRPKPRFIDFFAGAGGMSAGIEMAGFEPLLAIELEPAYSNTYKLNHPNTTMLVKDISKIKGKDILKATGLKRGELELLAGGPPCQGFSINAPVRSLDDQRNGLVKEYLRLADELHPHAILIENVPGFVSLGKGTVVQLVYQELERMGYSVHHKILFAGHYGVPQMRFRTIFLASRDGKKIDFPEPTHFAEARANFTGAKELCIKVPPLFASVLKPHTTAWQAISDLPALKAGQAWPETPYDVEVQNEYQQLLRAKSTLIANHSCAKLGKNNLERLKYIPQGGSWRDIPHELLPAGMQRARRSDHTKRYGRLHPDGLCSTILTKCDPHWGSFFHPFQDRAISVREAARIQSFPDHYVFTGSVTQQFEQVGNAVPPLMAKALAESVKAHIFGTREQNVA